MHKNGYVVFNEKTQKVEEFFSETAVDENGRPMLAVLIPNSNPTLVVHAPAFGKLNEEFSFLEKWSDDPGAPSKWHQKSGTELKRDGIRLIEIVTYESEPSLTPSTQDVNAERDRRIETSFPFMEKRIQFRPGDRENINGASSLAIIAIMGGAKPGDTKWHGGEEDFAWITADNSLLILDAFQTIGMGKAAAEWKSKNIFAARELKNQPTIPYDFENDKYWPA